MVAAAMTMAWAASAAAVSPSWSATPAHSAAQAMPALGSPCTMRVRLHTHNALLRTTLGSVSRARARSR